MRYKRVIEYRGIEIKGIFYVNDEEATNLINEWFEDESYESAGELEYIQINKLELSGNDFEKARNKFYN